MWAKTVEFFKCIKEIITIVVDVIKKSIWEIIKEKIKKGN